MKQYVIKVNGISYQVEVEETAAGSFAPAAVQAAPAAALAPAAASPAAAPAAPPVIAPAPVLSSAAPAGSELVKAPMPGTILEVTVQLGESVTRGQVLCILEAMKMENEIVAPKEGTIASVSITKGSTVNAGDPLVSIA
ncbi:MAG TPA: biotin/lipoyl-containing protein [Clostridia bacterium]